MLKMPTSLDVDFSQLIVLIKNTGTTILLALTAHQISTFTGASVIKTYRRVAR
jgi:hypothetical protein